MFAPNSNPYQNMFSVPAPQLQRMAGEVVPLPMYPGQADARMQAMENMKNQIMQSNPNTPLPRINRAFDQHFGGGAQVLPFPGR